MLHVPFMMMAFYLFCTCVTMQIIFSFIYPVQHTIHSEKLYWTSLWEPLTAKGWNGIGNYKFLSVALLIVMAGLYYIFK
jgi:SSS family solute:Na+ symporter